MYKLCYVGGKEFIKQESNTSKDRLTILTVACPKPSTLVPFHPCITFKDEHTPVS